MTVHFLDTTILCNLVPVPGRDDQRTPVLGELQGFIERSDVLILPVTAVVERFLAGGDTGQEFVELATAGLGSGDVLILAEIATYRQRSRLPVSLWTHNRQLGSYS